MSGDVDSACRRVQTLVALMMITVTKKYTLNRSRLEFVSSIITQVRVTCTSKGVQGQIIGVGAIKPLIGGGPSKKGCGQSID